MAESSAPDAMGALARARKESEMNKPQMYIMQGIPGSGKSTWAFALGKGKVHKCSADDYFASVDPNYHIDGSGFDVSKLAEAHQQCFRRALSAIQRRAQTVVIDNTNLDNESIAPYVILGQSHGYDVTIVRVHCAPEVAAERNRHGVPAAAIERMHKAFVAWQMWPPHKFGGVKVMDINA